MISTKHLGKNGIKALFSSVLEKLDKKVDKVDGKSLSTNDFTNELKSKLDGIAAGANKTVVDSSLNEESTNPVQNKAVYTEMNKKANAASLSAVATSGNYSDLNGTPTIPSNTNQLTNGAGYQTSAQVQQAINEAIGQMTGIDFKIVTELPTAGVAGTFYLIAHDHEASDSYDEYVWISSSSKFEKVGNTDIDLSGYVKSTDLVEITNEEIDAILDSLQ